MSTACTRVGGTRPLGDWAAAAYYPNGEEEDDGIPALIDEADFPASALPLLQQVAPAIRTSVVEAAAATREAQQAESLRSRAEAAPRSASNAAASTQEAVSMR